MQHILMIQTYGWPLRGGPGEAGTSARIAEAVRLITTGGAIPHEVVALFPQGHSKQSPTQGTEGASLGEMAANEFLSHAGMHHIRGIVAEPRSWGTLNDMRAAYCMVRDLNLGDPVHFHFVTDPNHMARVMLIWHMTHPPGWSASFHPVEQHRMSEWERWVREPIACIVTLIKLL